VKPVAFICVNGILTAPGSADGWTDRAVTWLNLHTAGKAEKFEYAAGALTRRFRQSRRAQAIARMAGFYRRAGFDLVFLAHSNGCDLVERVLDSIGGPVRSVHFFAAASSGRQLANALSWGTCRAAYLYGSPRDRALRLARISSRLLGWAGLGYGALGLHGAEFAEMHPGAIAITDEAQGHSSWFARGEPFERTMRRVAEFEFTATPADGEPKMLVYHV
jgi:hypothetical protein